MRRLCMESSRSYPGRSARHAIGDRRFMSKCRNRFTRLTKYPAHLSAVERCDSLSGETQNRQQLMSNFIAPSVATCGVSTQKSAKGIVLPTKQKEGPNAEKRMTLP